MDSVEESGTGDDLSSGAFNPTPRDGEINLTNYEIEEKRQALSFRSVIFYTSGGIILFMYGALICYIFFDASPSSTERVSISAMLAAIPSVLSLALMRNVFARSEKDRANVDDGSVLLTLAKEIIGLIKPKG